MSNSRVVMGRHPEIGLSAAAFWAKAGDRSVPGNPAVAHRVLNGE